MFKKKKNEKSETAIAAVADDDVSLEKKKSKSLFKTIGGVLDTVNSAVPKVTDFYNRWIKPVWTNRAQIKRRLNMLTTIISLVFFIIYVPLVLFAKVANGLKLGWQVALYVCLGVYFIMLVALLAVSLLTARSNSTTADKKRKTVYRAVLFGIRLLSISLAITALVISAAADTSALNTLAMVVAIISIIFSLIPLIFGGLFGFFKWLISPASSTVKHPFSFVALEWNQILTESERMTKSQKKAYKKHGTRVDTCLDKYILPLLGGKEIRSLNSNDVVKMLAGVPEEDKNLTEWIIKDIFDYALNNGYVEADPCTELNLEGNIESELKRK